MSEEKKLSQESRKEDTPRDKARLMLHNIVINHYEDVAYIVLKSILQEGQA